MSLGRANGVTRRELGRHRSDPETPMSIESNPTDFLSHTHH
jgi:hypothetical protein